MARTLREAFYQSPAYPPYVRTVRAMQALREQLVPAARRAVDQIEGKTPLPPGRLMAAVAGTDDMDWFLKSGLQGKTSIENILSKNGIAFEQLGAVLDFGCGVGRVIRHWEGVNGPKLYGSDYNPELIAWCQANLRFASFKVNALVGTLPYPDATFDLIYALSVFTHLTETQQDFWITELSRLLKPGGYLLISTHGDYYLPNIPAKRQADYERGERVVAGSWHAGTNECTTFHPPAYVQTKLAPQLITVDFIPEGALGNPRQDYTLLRKPTEK